MVEKRVRKKIERLERKRDCVTKTTSVKENGKEKDREKEMRKRAKENKKEKKTEIAVSRNID